ncbi:MAG: hypothetical protein PVI92_13075 [Chromatiales bacterium]|jgi:hypothetical protein
MGLQLKKVIPGFDFFTHRIACTGQRIFRESQRYAVCFYQALINDFSKFNNMLPASLVTALSIACLKFHHLWPSVPMRMNDLGAFYPARSYSGSPRISASTATNKAGMSLMTQFFTFTTRSFSANNFYLKKET